MENLLLDKKDKGLNSGVVTLYLLSLDLCLLKMAFSLQTALEILG
jgi:hypothetical protein